MWRTADPPTRVQIPPRPLTKKSGRKETMRRKKHYIEAIIILYITTLLILPLANKPLKAEPSASLLINEMMYYPLENENTNEWIELYNPTSTPIDTAGWMIADEKETDTLLGDSANGDGTTIIPPGGYAIVTDKGSTIYDTYTVADAAIRLLVDDSTVCGYGLNNQKEKILLLDPMGTCVDAVEWGFDYDDVPGSPAKLVTKGNSLARYGETDQDDSSLDFVECSTPTPGYQNVWDEEPSNVDLEENIGCDSAVVLITELYYHAHANMKNEFVRLFNPTNKTIDVSGWYLTDECWKEPDDQAKIIFPKQTQMLPNTSWFITQNATAFLWQTATLPDFEYTVESQPTVRQLLTHKTVSFSNTGGLVGLYTASSTLVDLIIYGDTNEYISCWDGPSVPPSGQGVILKRNKLNGTYIDTNTAMDWIPPRIYRIGQSDLTHHTYQCSGEVIVFVSPDNSYQTIINELRNARTSIDINMYEFTSSFLHTELLNTLQRNIKVRLFMEGSPVGGINEREKYILSSLADNGGQVRFIYSNTTNRIYARYQFTHAKYIVIDNETVIIESCNWGNTGVPKNPTYGNREWGIVIKNQDTAAFFLTVFEEDWNPKYCDSYSLESINLSFPQNFILSDYAPTGPYTPCFTQQTIIGSYSITPVFSPDTSEQAILDAIDAATTSIYVQQLYIYKDWGETISPLVERLISKAAEGIDIKIILNYNPSFSQTIVQTNETKTYLEEHGIAVKYLSTEWGPFTAVHNKGMICDNKTVLISSINWNEQSVRKNREAGIIIENEEVATYYANVFFHDWSLDTSQESDIDFSWADYKYLVLIAVVICITVVLIARDWRKRKWR
jgi:cardiolipin synthase A/B